LKLPTDLLGIAAATYQLHADRNIAERANSKRTQRFGTFIDFQSSWPNFSDGRIGKRPDGGSLRRLAGLTKLTRDEMCLAGYLDISTYANGSKVARYRLMGNSEINDGLDASRPSQHYHCATQYQ
jgi:hypothetical protein